MIRLDDWWMFHVALLLTVAYASILFNELPADRALPLLLRLLISIVCLAAFAHVVNDMADVEQDSLAGKSNAVAGLRSWQQATLVVGLLVGGLAVWIGSSISTWLLVLLAGTALLQPLYVCRPIRLKEQGIWGVLADALHVHALPVFFITALFADLASASVWHLFPVTVTLWVFLLGIRGILYHQVIDAANDAKSGIVTFVATCGVTRTRLLARRFVFPAELLAFFLCGIAVFFFAPAIVLFFLCYGGTLLLMRAMGLWKVSWADPIPTARGEYAPLLAFYRGWPAIGFLLLLTFQDWRYFSILVVHSLIFLQELTDQTDVFRFAVHYVRHGSVCMRRLAFRVVASVTRYCLGG